MSNDYCPNCNSPARTRALPPLLDDVVGPAVAKAANLDLPLLGFAMAGIEKQLIDKVFPLVKSVSLFGNYGGDHEMGVDARDLSRYADSSFAGHFSILLYDYFTEQDDGIREAYRVLAPGGIFFTQLGPYRLLDGWDAPYQIKEVRGRPGYFEYLPEGVALADIRVGRQWFLQAMEDAGFKVQWIRAHDRATGADLDWFVGYKPGV
ncbi:MAG: class I SAM-dependent methyltransferase [Caulobacteraceae bacterium]|nr:class I SAM-dependent methyltransferase [Caulobacteraceae bacterium]